MKNKKWFLALAALLVVTTLTTGCGQKAELKDGSQVAVKLDGIKITADEYYNEIKGINIATLVDMIDHQLFDKKYGKTDEENGFESLPFFFKLVPDFPRWQGRSQREGHTILFRFD